MRFYVLCVCGDGEKGFFELYLLKAQTVNDMTCICVCAILTIIILLIMVQLLYNIKMLEILLTAGWDNGNAPADQGFKSQSGQATSNR